MTKYTETGLRQRVKELERELEVARAQQARDLDTLAAANEALQKGIVRMRVAGERIQMLEGHMKAKGLLSLDGSRLLHHQ